MRTTIRLPEDNRETLLSIAAERGEKSISRVVEEAVAFYLSERNKPAEVPAVIESAPVVGRWQKMGAALDEQLGTETGVLALVRALIRGGLRRVPILRA
jgi:Ribbon-helix-helix protein, copG family